MNARLRSRERKPREVTVYPTNRPRPFLHDENENRELYLLMGATGMRSVRVEGGVIRYRSTPRWSSERSHRHRLKGRFAGAQS